ncbi:hypothetical protein OSTOST_15536 [Ostertagia ostertagi]
MWDIASTFGEKLHKNLTWNEQLAGFAEEDTKGRMFYRSLSRNADRYGNVILMKLFGSERISEKERVARTMYEKREHLEKAMNILGSRLIFGCYCLFENGRIYDEMNIRCFFESLE